MFTNFKRKSPLNKQSITPFIPKCLFSTQTFIPKSIQQKPFNSLQYSFNPSLSSFSTFKYNNYPTKSLYNTNIRFFSTKSLSTSFQSSKSSLLRPFQYHSTFRTTRPLRREELYPQQPQQQSQIPNPLQNQQQQSTPHRLPIDPITGQPLNSILPPHLVPTSPLNPFKPGEGTTSTTTSKVTSKIIKNNNSWSWLLLKSLFRLAIVGTIVGSWGYYTFFTNPELLARIVGVILMNQEPNEYILPEHKREYYYPLENDGFVPIQQLYKSYQKDIVKKLFHIFHELNHLDANFDEVSSRLSQHYRELLKVRAHKIDDLDLWILPLHLTKSQKRIRQELSIDPQYPAQIDLDVCDFIRNETLWTYWDVISNRIDSITDEAELRARLREIIEIKSEIDQVIDVLDLTSLIAYESKLFTYQYVPQTDEERDEWIEFQRVKENNEISFSTEATWWDKLNEKLFPSREYENFTVHTGDIVDAYENFRDNNDRNVIDSTSPYLLHERSQQRDQRREARKLESEQRLEDAVERIQYHADSRRELATQLDEEQLRLQEEMFQNGEYGTILQRYKSEPIKPTLQEREYAIYNNQDTKKQQQEKQQEKQQITQPSIDLRKNADIQTQPQIIAKQSSNRGRVADDLGYGSKQLYQVGLGATVDKNDLDVYNSYPTPNEARQLTIEESHRERAERQKQAQIQAQHEEFLQQNKNNQQRQLPQSSQRQSTSSKYKDLEERLIQGTSGGGYIDEEEFKNMTANKGSPPSRWR